MATAPAMTLAERARLATSIRQQSASERAERLRQLVSKGAHLKEAAWVVGVSYRTARRYRVGRPANSNSKGSQVGQ